MAFPQILHCLVSDGTHVEGNTGKLTILGFLGVAPDVSVRISDFGKPLNLQFIFLGREGDDNTYTIGFQIIDQNGAVVVPCPPNPPQVEVKKGTRSSFVLGGRIGLFSPGQYAFQFLVDGAPAYSASFLLEQA